MDGLIWPDFNHLFSYVDIRPVYSCCLLMPEDILGNRSNIYIWKVHVRHLPTSDKKYMFGESSAPSFCISYILNVYVSFGNIYKRHCYQLMYPHRGASPEMLHHAGTARAREQRRQSVCACLLKVCALVYSKCVRLT